MANSILLVFAHPLYEKSRIHHALCNGLNRISGIHFHDLYEVYPEFNIDVKHEQKLLLEHDIIIWQHPVYWYNVPPLLKQWIDMVLEFGWAYGKNGNKLEGKHLLQVASTGGKAEAYSAEGRNKHSIREYFWPHEQTAHLCKMNYLPPYIIHGTHSIGDEELGLVTQRYHLVLEQLKVADLTKIDWASFTYLNNWEL